MYRSLLRCIGLFETYVVHVRMCVCMYVCVRVHMWTEKTVRERMCVCVYVCVRVYI